MRQMIEIEVPEGKQAIWKDGKIIFEDITYYDISKKLPYNSTVHTNVKFQSKCITFRKLLEVANYLNGDWKPDWNNKEQYKYVIAYNHSEETFDTDYFRYLSENTVYFSSKENALKAVEIIGEEELKKFFSNNTSYVL